MVKQQQLWQSPSGKRIALLEDDEVEIKVRVPTAVAKAVEANPKGAAQHLELVVENFLGRTKWECKEDPPARGWWEVTDSKTGLLDARWWFEPGRIVGVGDAGVIGVSGCWFRLAMVSAEERLVDRMDALVFKMMYAWRGLDRDPGGKAYMNQEGTGGRFYNWPPHLTSFAGQLGPRRPARVALEE